MLSDEDIVRTAPISGSGLVLSITRMREQRLFNSSKRKFSTRMPRGHPEVIRADEHCYTT